MQAGPKAVSSVVHPAFPEGILKYHGSRLENHSRVWSEILITFQEGLAEKFHLTTDLGLFPQFLLSSKFLFTFFHF